MDSPIFYNGDCTVGFGVLSGGTSVHQLEPFAPGTFLRRLSLSASSDTANSTFDFSYGMFSQIPTEATFASLGRLLFQGRSAGAPILTFRLNDETAFGCELYLNHVVQQRQRILCFRIAATTGRIDGCVSVEIGH